MVIMSGSIPKWLAANRLPGAPEARDDLVED
jgi:hypothetical protein